MILTVSELLQFVQTNEDYQVLKAKLSALELLIRGYTNNNFQRRAFRAVAVAISDGNQLLLPSTANPFKPGDTLQISEADLNSGLVTVVSSSGDTIAVEEDLYDESAVVITKVEYPADVKMGVVNMLKWDLENRDKAGVASETISRHSVTYFDQTGSNSIMGYPSSLIGFLKPYMKARFGRGINV